MGGQFTPVLGWSIYSGNQAEKVDFWGGQLPPVLGGQFGRIFQLHLYLRVSSSVQEEEGTSLKTQKDIGIELAKKLGMNYLIHNEGGMSSSKDTLDNRPVLMNILKQMDEGIIKNIYVWNTDRLSRNQITWYTIRQVMVKNGVVLYTSNGVHDTQDFMENMILGILSEVSQYDNRVRTERSRLGKIEKVKLNYWRGGDCPYGYKLSFDGKGNKMVENEEESVWVRYIYSEYSKETPLKQIKSVLEKNGIKTRRENNQWSMGALQVLLRNETYLGFDHFIDKKTNITIRNKVPQIIPNKLWGEVQERRNKLLKRKNQINRTERFYLFRDFLVCECGTPIGGRVKDKERVRQYYCPLCERKFNNTYKNEIACTMKKCMNIPTTDKILWNKIIDILSDTIELKTTLKDKSIAGISLKSRDLKKEIQIKNDRFKELNKIKIDLEKGLVEIETSKILNQYASDEVYQSLKKDLTKRYNQTKSEMEDVKNALTLVGNQDKWFDWIEYFGTYISGTRDIPDIQKKIVLQKVLDNIVVSYDLVEKVHRLVIHFRIPVIVKNYTNIQRKPKKYLSEPSVTPADITDQLFDVEDYSTVMRGSANIANPADVVSQQKGYAVKLVAEMTAANLWSSPYSLYQQHLFETIRQQHEDEGKNFKQISDWLNDNRYLTPRGKMFQEAHTWSIYTKKVRSIHRFTRQYDHKIQDMGVDVVDFIPATG